MGGTDNGAEIVRVFNAVEDDDEFRGGGDFVKRGVFFFGAEGDDSLMRFDAGETVERAAVFKSDGRARGAGEVDDFLQTLASGAAGDEDALGVGRLARRASTTG